jgi:hypothetical protein
VALLGHFPGGVWTVCGTNLRGFPKKWCKLDATESFDQATHSTWHNGNLARSSASFWSKDDLAMLTIGMVFPLMLVRAAARRESILLPSQTC